MFLKVWFLAGWVLLVTVGKGSGGRLHWVDQPGTEQALSAPSAGPHAPWAMDASNTTTTRNTSNGSAANQTKDIKAEISVGGKNHCKDVPKDDCVFWQGPTGKRYTYWPRFGKRLREMGWRRVENSSDVFALYFCCGGNAFMMDPPPYPRKDSATKKEKSTENKEEKSAETKEEKSNRKKEEKSNGKKEEKITERKTD